MKNATTVVATLLMTVLAVMTLVSCGGSSSSTTPAPTSTVEVVSCASVTSSTSITALSQSFSPATDTIPVNGVVRWESGSTIQHTVTSGTAGTSDGKFNQTLNPNSSVCLKFTQAGTYNYYCTFHYTMGMTGVITVQ